MRTFEVTITTILVYDSNNKDILYLERIVGRFSRIKYEKKLREQFGPDSIIEFYFSKEKVPIELNEVISEKLK